MHRLVTVGMVLGCLVCTIRVVAQGKRGYFVYDETTELGRWVNRPAAIAASNAAQYAKRLGYDPIRVKDAAVKAGDAVEDEIQRRDASR